MTAGRIFPTRFLIQTQGFMNNWSGFDVKYTVRGLKIFGCFAKNIGICVDNIRFARVDGLEISFQRPYILQQDRILSVQYCSLSLKFFQDQKLNLDRLLSRTVIK